MMDKLIKLYRPLNTEEASVGILAELELKSIKSKPSKAIDKADVLKYNPAKTMFKAEWNAVSVQAARGNVVQHYKTPHLEYMSPFNMPLPKMFNVGEMGLHFPRDSEVVMHRKRNGFMITTFVFEGKVHFATTGTTDSDYAKMAAEHFTPELCKVIAENYTYDTLTFEVCDKRDPHIIPEPEGIYLLGIRSNAWGSAYFSPVRLLSAAVRLAQYGVMFDHPFYAKHQDALAQAKAADHEGFVLWCWSEELECYVPLKVKSDEYLVKKLLARSNENNLLRKIEMHKARDHTNEEYWPLFDYIEGNLQTFLNLDEQGKLGFISDWIRATNLKE